MDFVEGNNMRDTTRAGKSSPNLIAVQSEPLLTPLIPEKMIVRGARRWLDDGCPDDTAIEYPGWVQK